MEIKLLGHEKTSDDITSRMATERRMRTIPGMRFPVSAFLCASTTSESDESRRGPCLCLLRLLACLCLAGCSSSSDRDADPPHVDSVLFSLGAVPLSAIVDVDELPDGRLLVTGPGSGQLVCRLLASGELDVSFADAGCVSPPPFVFTNVKPMIVVALAGAIDVFGTWSPVQAPTEIQVFNVHMSGAGVVDWISSSNLGDGAFLVEVMKQGDAIVLAGGTSTGAFLARDNGIGFDPTFAGDGYGIARFGASHARDAVYLKNDRFVVSTGTTLHAFDADGLPDPGFGLSGTIELPFEALTLATEGSAIVAAGPGMAIARVSYDGEVTGVFDPLDPGAGAVATPLDVIVDYDGSILLGGMISSTADLMALGRRKRSGAADLDFGPGGTRQYGQGQAFDVDILRDGRYLMAGTRDGSTAAMSIVTRP